MTPSQKSRLDRSGGDDAVAFTSGPSGAPFAAGVVHAWLASDRRPPLVATGISMGTVAAAAMRRVYHELENDDADDVEVKRWRWYQRYHQAITDNPFNSLWKAVPDPVDFFSETPPVQDPALLSKFTEKTYEHLYEQSEQARRHFYLLVKLGSWLGTLPVSISTLATTIVMFVRRKEKYSRNPLTSIMFYGSAATVAAGIWFHVVFSPRTVWEGSFNISPRRYGFRPLFGWMSYLLVVFLPLVLSGVVAALVLFFRWLLGLSWSIYAEQRVFTKLPPHSTIGDLAICRSLIAVLAVISICGLCKLTASFLLPEFKLQTTEGAAKRGRISRFLLWLLMDNVDITKGLLHPFEMQDALYDLFVKNAPSFVTDHPSDGPVLAVFVCAALEKTEQITLKGDYPVVEALTAALSVPGLLPPKLVRSEWIDRINEDRERTQPMQDEEFHVIDGAAVRFNPIPAFFNWIRSQKIDQMRLLENKAGEPTLHVVYNVPTGYDGSVQSAEGIPYPDIVVSALKALQLARRRDTRQEVRQTNTISRLEYIRRKTHAGITQTVTKSKEKYQFAIFADEIAPRKEFDFGNGLAPDSQKLRNTVADGCRSTLETLYHADIHLMLHGTESVSCKSLLERIAPRRSSFFHSSPGLPAVCECCSRRLQYRSPQEAHEAQKGLLPTYGHSGPPTSLQLAEDFPQLTVNGTKKIFLGSGGVFRGAFHVGVLAAMQQTNCFPDIVVGASVGTLMGGALCRMSAVEKKDVPAVLGDLTVLFIDVDKQVSLTATFKSAVKQLGTRARSIQLSPAQLARKIRAGSQTDAGYAATGAPPELTDALSCLLTIPHRETIEITSEFVAGHFTVAIASFLNQVRRETLSSFNIRNCLMGVSLLEPATRRLLKFSTDGAELSEVQPYQKSTPSGRQVAFFGTTSFLNASTPLLLGRDFLSTGDSWNAVEEGLCSSAFPAVFAARSEADLMPGVGRSDRYFADGGMFDNLPFFPALEVIADVQNACGAELIDEITSEPNPEALAILIRRLQYRSDHPSMIICAGLNEKPQTDGHLGIETMFAIKHRADTLSDESKTNTFINSGRTSNRLFSKILAGNLSVLTKAELLFLNRFVPAEVVDITPIDEAHINPTFAFCKSLSLEPLRVQSSIADGCFQTLSQLSDLRNSEMKHLLNDQFLHVTPKIPEAGANNSCYYFAIDGQSFTCPFSLTSGAATKVYEVCGKDPAHRENVECKKTLRHRRNLTEPQVP